MDSRGHSFGDLFWDDGDSIDSYESGAYNYVEFNCEGGKFESNPKHVGFAAEDGQMKLGYIGIFGVAKNCSSVTLNGKPVKFYYDEQDQVKEKLISLVFIFTEISFSFSVPWHS